MATVTFIKYERQSAGALHGVAAYVSQEEKTMQEDGPQLVSGQNCNPQLTVQEFIATRTMHRKDSPIYFYHYVQSFHPGESVTGELAHEVAKEFAAKAWPNSEVLIATHMDAPHIHSHFIVNAVCYETGHMLRQGPRTLATLRPISDEICMAHGLSVLPKQQQKKAGGMSTREYRAAAKGESWKFRLMNTIDDCMKYARTREDFIALMKSESYGVRWEDTRQSITYTIPSGMKCRDDRLHDEKYLKEALEHEFRIRRKLLNGGIEANEYAGEIAGAEYAVGAPNGAGMVGACDDAQRALPHDDGTVRSRGGAKEAGDRPVQFNSGLVQSPQYQPDMDTIIGGTGGTEEDSGAARTGWEAERTALFPPQAQTSTAAPVAGMVPAGTDLSGIAGDLAQLGHALERNQNTVPVRDATTTPTHHERGKKRKLALGQKADDHEDEQVFQQTMY